uniref:Endolytic murein transglycosylase n=1 Tax=Thermodesulfobacterium geofontis TaxID=1295609 RepID=A0A7C4NT91_9BACT
MKISRYKKKKLIIPLFLGILVLTLAVSWISNSLFKKETIKSAKEPIIVEIEKGDNIFKVAKKLKEKGLIKSELFFILKAFKTGTYNKIKAGEYAFYPSQSVEEVLTFFKEGKIYLHKITIPEGSTIWQIADILEKNKICKKEEFLSLAENPSVAESFKLPGPTLEGYLYPDTYFFHKDTPPQVVIQTMIENFWKHWGKFREVAEKQKKPLKKVIILASIVEKEAYYPEEKPIIAAVYLNRLKKGMPLQADPTINYALRDFRRLTYKDYYSVKSPYNTYLEDGLPPTPICNPGEESIKAVLFPAKVPYLYFVAKGDGSHYFSKTYKEHLEAIKKIRNNKESTGNSNSTLISEKKDIEKENL